jgi:hypothetical protein
MAFNQVISFLDAASDIFNIHKSNSSSLMKNGEVREYLCEIFRHFPETSQAA